MRIAVVEDEPVYGRSIKTRLEPLGIGVDAYDRPRRMPTDLSIYSHAVVDLAMGKADHDQPIHDVPEVETGADAIHRLVDAGMPQDNIVVMTRLDTDLLREIGKAIRQHWPAICFLDKENEVLIDSIEQAILTNEITDSNEIAQHLADVTPVSADHIGDTVESMDRSSKVKLFLLFLADSGAEPRRSTIQAHFGHRDPQSTRNLQSAAAAALKQGDYFAENAKVELKQLWMWCRARRAILHNLFDTEDDADTSGS